MNIRKVIHMKLFTFFLMLSTLFLFTSCDAPDLSGKKVKREYFTGGKIRSEFFMDDDSGQNGTLKLYGYNGKVTSISHLTNGVKDGLETLYDEEGHIIRQTPYVNGRKHGIVKVLYPNGENAATIPYYRGLKQGRAVAYNPNGSVSKTATFRNGKLIN